MPCDLCNGPIDNAATRYSCSQFRQAVRAGLRPSTVTNMAYDISAVFGISQDETDAGWVHMAMSDSTDWVLCANCNQQAALFLKSSSGASHIVVKIVVALLVLAGLTYFVSVWLSR